MKQVLIEAIVYKNPGGRGEHASLSIIPSGNIISDLTVRLYEISI